MTIISFTYKFIFCKTLKTAGTALEVSLSALLPPTDVVTPVVPEEPGHQPRNYRYRGKRLRNHVPMTTIRQIYGDQLAGFSSFCIERHPIEKCLSHFAMLRHSPHHAHRQDASSLTWADYIETGLFPMDLPRYASQREDGHWSKEVDLVIDYPDLETGVRKFLSERGLPGFQLASRAKSGFRQQPGIPTPDQITQEERNRIMEVFNASNTFLRDNFGINYT
ncbi:hypothetical protein [Cyanobium sp. NIES-981]|uniref:hypothetical protein n=1 Tax=Cyanobium sp. NIES-981 TaxID=1851505 RepID=UPI0012F96961|nr:hypothetical protein [Cyanobium sp. NIES-981]